MAASFTDRMLGAARLDAATYEQVEADEGATLQALAVVGIAAAASAIGSITGGVYLFFLGLLGPLIGWVVFAGIVFFVGGVAFPEPNTQADAGQVLRTVGFASSPGVLYVLGLIPFVGGLISFAIAVWIAVATVVAVRQSLDYESTPRAVGVVLVGWALYLAFSRLPFILL
jgi:hypothetical protein